MNKRRFVMCNAKWLLFCQFLILSFLLFTLNLRGQVFALPQFTWADWHPTDNLIALGRDDRIAILDETLQEVDFLAFSQDQFQSVALVKWSPDGAMLAAVLTFWEGDGTNTRLLVWEVSQKQILLNVTEVGTPIVWSGDGQYIIVGSLYNNRSFKIYDVSTQQVVNEFSAQYGVGDIDWHPTNVNLMVVGGRESTIVINPFTNQEITALSGSGSGQMFSPDGTKLAAFNTSAPVISIYDTSNWTVVFSVPTPNGVSDDGFVWADSTFIVLSTAGIVTKWNVDTQQQVTNYPISFDDFSRLFWKPDGTRFFAFNLLEDNISIADGDTGQILVQYPPTGNQAPSANAGSDQTIIDGNNSGSESVTLDGSGSSDSDGTITSYVWTENSTQIATGATPTVDLAVGTHIITLTVTDDDGATATDEVVVAVNPSE